jgi:serine/threonine protein kinase
LDGKTKFNMQAPEVAKGKGYSAKVDMWSLGCLVLEMLTGQQPWSKVAGNIIYLLGKGQSPPIPEELSDSAKDFIKLCFTSDPEARPTATQLCSHPFVQIDPEEFDYRTWYEEACEAAALAAEEMSSESESSYDSDDGYFDVQARGDEEAGGGEEHGESDTLTGNDGTVVDSVEDV